MYAAYIVHRTQIYPDDAQVQRLRKRARATRRTMSDLIREAIDENLDRPEVPLDFATALRNATGIWADRGDLPPTDDYIRELRRGGRRLPAPE